LENLIKMEEGYQYSESDSDAFESDSEKEGIDYPESWKCLEITKRTQTIVKVEPIMISTLPRPSLKRKMLEPRSTSLCAICQETFVENIQRKDIYCSFKCGNVFHEDCAKTLQSCPLCRCNYPWYSFKIKH